MSRFHSFVKLLAVIGIAAPSASAQDSKTSLEVRELRVLVERQSKQIDLLSEQVAKLRLALEGKAEAGSAAVPVATAVAPAAPVVSTEFPADPPKAEPADGKRHVVIKGETFTSIAKHYSIPISDLKKANKEVDERKLQIGQTLSIPTPKSPEAPTEKKENP